MTLPCAAQRRYTIASRLAPTVVVEGDLRSGLVCRWRQRLSVLLVPDLGRVV